MEEALGPLLIESVFMKKPHQPLRSVLALCLFIWAMATASAKDNFSMTGAMNVARRWHTQTLLSDGQLLVAGGETEGCLASAELYDPKSSSWIFTGAMVSARSRYSATILPNGKVLVAGGWSGTSGLSSAELYDPSTGIWSETGSLNSNRYGHTAIALPNGKVLVSGGWCAGSLAASTEVYDPATGTWVQTGPMNSVRSAHTMNLLTNGKVLVTGGAGSVALSNSELYDPVTGICMMTGSMNSSRSCHTATILANGKVLITGGFSNTSNASSRLASAEIYDPESGTWSTAQSMGGTRWGHTATLLSSGRVLVAGGYGYNIRLASSEMYDPTTDTWSSTGFMGNSRGDHAATLLKNDQLLVSGGLGNNWLSSAELFDPAITGSISITQQPTNTAVIQGANTVFSAVATGLAPISYQWQKSGVDISNATNAVLTLHQIQLNDAGDYAVKITNPLGSVTSNVATLTVIPDADGDGLSDADETNVYHTDPTKVDTDGDGLSDFAEVQTHGTNPLLADTDGDGFTDSYEIQTGKSPTSAADKPLLVAEVRTAIEFSFPSATGKTYRVEGSADLVSWSTVEDGIVGTGAGVTRFYSTRNTPSRFFRVAESANP
jgi:hypothetical protein